jgi:hypothetical protein
MKKTKTLYSYFELLKNKIVYIHKKNVFIGGKLWDFPLNFLVVYTRGGNTTRALGKKECRLSTLSSTLFFLRIEFK